MKNQPKFNINEFNERNNYLEEKISPKISNKIDYDDISRNVTTVYRLFQSINITVNISDFLSQGANYTEMQISFTNSSINTYVMSNYTNNAEYTYIYTPEYDAPLGLQKVNFLIYNKTGGPILNANTTLTNFTIVSNYILSNIPPDGEYQRDSQIDAELDVDPIDSLNFTWNVSVVDNMLQRNIYHIGNNIDHFSLFIDEGFEINEYYYIKLNMTDDNGRTKAAYYRFKVVHSNNLIKADTMKFNPTSVYRTQICTFSLNISLEESHPDNVTVSISLFQPGSELPTKTYSLTHKGSGVYSVDFTIPASQLAGNYRCKIEASDNEKNGSQSLEKFLTVKNNLPAIDGYEINNYDTDESISVLYGEDLVFEFDVFDVEGVAYITLLLINEDDDEYEITREYEEDLEITVRTVELITGTWDIYVYVTDTDGATVGLDDDFDTAPQKITIIPDTLGEMLSWIMLALGLISGVLFGTAISYYILKSQKLKPEKEIDVIEKKLKKEKIPRKVKPTPVKREAAKKLIEEEKPEKKEPKPPRKIKRKLK